jgi:hypothetical protein
VSLRRLALSLLVACAAATAAAARAEPSRSFDLAIESCPAVDTTRLRELIAIEIGTVAAAAPPRATTIRLACTGARVAIEMTDTSTGERSNADIDLATTAEPARPRLLSLTVTELMAETWAERRASASALPARTPDPALAGSGPAPQTRSPVRVFAVAGVRRIGQPRTWLGGGGIGCDLGLTTHLALTADVRVETGETATALAAIDWRTGTGSLGVAVGAGRGRLGWDIVPGFTVGAVRLSATPTSSESRGAALTGLWAGPTLATRVRRTFGNHAYLQLELAAGAITRSVVGLVNNDSPLVRIQGGWGAAGLGGGVAF